MKEGSQKAVKRAACGVRVLANPPVAKTRHCLQRGRLSVTYNDELVYQMHVVVILMYVVGGDTHDDD